MVGLVIVSHSAALADGVAELAREMGGEEVAIETAGGLEDGAIGTDAERVRAAVERVRSPDGVLVLMDLGSALMSAEMAVEMLDPDGGPIGSPPRRWSRAPSPRRRGRAAGAALAEVAAEARGALRMKTSQLGEEDDAEAPPSGRRRRRTPGSSCACAVEQPARPARPPGGALRGRGRRPRRRASQVSQRHPRHAARPTAAA